MVPSFLAATAWTAKNVAAVAVPVHEIDVAIAAHGQPASGNIKVRIVTGNHLLQHNGSRIGCGTGQDRPGLGPRQYGDQSDEGEEKGEAKHGNDTAGVGTMSSVSSRGGRWSTFDTKSAR
jgi:hypothetical protein